MIDRIRQLMQYKSLTASQFADGIEVPRAVVSHILSERNKPSLEVVVKILQQHKDISMEWLLMGNGQMLKELAGNAVPDTLVEQPKAEQEKTIPATPEAARCISNIQNKEEAGSVPGQQGMDQKKVEKVMVFYNDRTFTEYTPS